MGRGARVPARFLRSGRGAAAGRPTTTTTIGFGPTTPTRRGRPRAGRQRRATVKKKREKAKAKLASAKASAAGFEPGTSQRPHQRGHVVPETALRVASAGGLNRDEIKRWCDAAKDGNVGAMRTMLAATPCLLHARGTGVGHTALHWACARGELAAVKWLLSEEAGADPNAVNSEGATPLHAAASNGRMDAVLALANAGADPEVRDSSGETPGDAARARGAVEVAAVLARGGEGV